MDASSAATFAPDWSTIDREIVCPLCDYNLRGLTEPRCPECGHQFDWGPLLNPINNTHRYLFEDHPEMNVRSFIWTVIATLRPRKFWSELRADQKVRMRRLIAYWTICNLIPLIFGVGWVAINRVTLLATPFAATRWLAKGSGVLVFPSSRPSPPPYYFVHSSWRNHDPILAVVGLPFVDDYIAGVFLSTCIANVLFSALLYVVLIAFRASMRQARVKSEHVMRCVAYSTNAVVWMGVLLAAGWVVALVLRVIAAPQIFDYPILENDLTETVVPALPYILALIAGYRLSIAYSRYLRFRHAVATILSVQFILLLIAFTIRTFIYTWEMGG